MNQNWKETTEISSICDCVQLHQCLLCEDLHILYVKDK